MVFIFPNYSKFTNVLRELFDIVRFSIVDAENNINFSDERINRIIKNVLNQLITWTTNEINNYNNGGFLIEDPKQWLKNRYSNVSNVLNVINEFGNIDIVNNYFQIIKTNLYHLSKSLKVYYINFKIKNYLELYEIPFHSEPEDLEINIHQSVTNQNNQLWEWRNILIQLINYEIITDEPSLISIIDFIDRNVYKLLES